MPFASTKALPLLVSAVLAGSMAWANAPLAANRDAAMNAVRTRGFSIGFSCGSMGPYARDAGTGPVVPEARLEKRRLVHFLTSKRHRQTDARRPKSAPALRGRPNGS